MVCESLSIFTQILIRTELDKSRSSTKKLGGSIFSSNPSSIPKELEPLVSLQQTITKLVLSTKTSVNAASQDYDKLTDPSAVTPSAPVHAARLNGLLKTLANAEGAVAESIKARKVLIEGLEKILDTNRTALAVEETQLENLSNRRTEIDEKKKEVEDSIMRGFAPNSNPSTPAGVGNGSPGVSQSPAQELDRPEVEALTPPGYPEPPTHEPIPVIDLDTSNGAEAISNALQNHQVPLQQYPSTASNVMSTISTAYARTPSSSGAGSAKKRKLSTNDDFPDLGGDAMDGLDADVAEMLRRDSGNGI
jgi:regulator of Ty1 transposition protein 103